MRVEQVVLEQVQLRIKPMMMRLPKRSKTGKTRELKELEAWGTQDLQKKRFRSTRFQNANHEASDFVMVSFEAPRIKSDNQLRKAIKDWSRISSLRLWPFIPEMLVLKEGFFACLLSVLLYVFEHPVQELEPISWVLKRIPNSAFCCDFNQLEVHWSLVVGTSIDHLWWSLL